MAFENSKKRKRAAVVLHQQATDTSKPTNVFRRKEQGRKGTLSIAIPGSIIANAPGLDLKTILAGRIARAASVFCVDEIVIFNDGQNEMTRERSQNRRPNGFNSGYQNRNDDQAQMRNADELLELLLKYSECPPYLRKDLFEFTPDLGKSGLLQSLDLPHHLKPDEWCQYREGVAFGPIQSQSDHTSSYKRQKPSQSQAKSNTSTLVDAGFAVSVPGDIAPYTRVTIKFDSAQKPKDFPYYSAQEGVVDEYSEPQVTGTQVDSSLPRVEGGYYWGYQVRCVSRLSSVFTECPFEGGYDVCIGTSERGQKLADILDKDSSSSLPSEASHVLLVFGGVAGLEVAVEADPDLSGKGITRSNVGDLFDFFVNVCPNQGSRTIRTEEALWITLSQLSTFIDTAL
ncbi:DUF171-domain-containing protein [Microthyrium microscopicum]|uniref:DUF171-domain-containing protein n=1 Tax=Microthyrium microscopicum TaxID=703497 RepID=A0A6A6UST6_9PEZI|nr:DUF171-domain-containing protein [Microthyrium microscopicum]